MNPTFESIEKYLRIALTATPDKAEDEVMKLKEKIRDLKMKEKRVMFD